jgi:hypothetical protein
VNGVSILGACVAFIRLAVPSSSFPDTRSVAVKPLLDKGFRDGPNLGWIFEVKNQRSKEVAIVPPLPLPNRHGLSIK